MSKCKPFITPWPKETICSENIYQLLDCCDNDDVNKCPDLDKCNTHVKTHVSSHVHNQNVTDNCSTCTSTSKVKNHVAYHSSGITYCCNTNHITENQIVPSHVTNENYHANAKIFELLGLRQSEK